jgi:2-succinyl-5-enolpyruvyl-6-hydroxy-3-cyclohexene-1-carboxylate synthase
VPTDKIAIHNLVELCALKGIKHVVLSPGSRNAPLTISFDEHEEITCYTVPDERSAGFFAIGIAQEIGETVAICCTSGSASLNYAPSIAEAFYQRIPLLILTSDRPVEWVDQGDGQTIVQRDIYKNFIRGSYELPQEVVHEDEIWSSNRITNEAIDLCSFPTPGPVHINIPLRESLYGKSSSKAEIKVIENLNPELTISDEDLDSLSKVWNSHGKKLILCGQMKPNESLLRALEIISTDDSVSILTESTANLWHPSFNSCIDRLISNFTAEDKNDFRPTLLITVGDAFISKKIKSFLRENKPEEHWNITDHDSHLDTFQSLTKTVRCQPSQFFHGIKDRLIPIQSGYKTNWKGRDLHTEDQHLSYINSCEFSDLKAFSLILDFIPDRSVIQMANSTAVRYVQLFNQIRSIEYYGNRGTSGIDGSTSTAAGMACKSEKLVTLITGDMSFFYDSNAFWNNHLTSNLKVIVINNSGGGIFRIIPGPSSTDQLEKFFETEQNMTCEHIAKQFNINYYSARNEAELETELASFFLPSENGRPSILEIVTPKLVNSGVLDKYFESLQH